MRGVDLQSFLDKFAQIDTGPRTLFVYAPLPAALITSLEKTQKKVSAGASSQEMDHITLVYIPDAMQDRSPEKIDAILASLRKVTDAAKPIKAKVQGWGYFDGAKKDGKPVTALVGLVDAPGLEDLHVALKKALKQKGVAPSSDHIYTAHFTFAYLEQGARVQNLPKLEGSFTINSVKVAADKVYTLALRGSVGAEAAKAAAANSDDFNTMDMRGVSPPPAQEEPLPTPEIPAPVPEAPRVLRDDAVPDLLENVIKMRLALTPPRTVVPLPWEEESPPALPPAPSEALPPELTAKLSYNLDGHAALTDRALDTLTAQGYRITPEQRVRLIQANKEVDKVNAKHLMISKKTSPFHFHKGEEEKSRQLIDDYYRRALNDNTTEGALDALGIALHTTQDEFSHAKQDVPGGVRGLITHIPGLPRFMGGRHSPDSIEKYPELAGQATDASTDLLRRFMDEREGGLGQVGSRPMQHQAILEEPESVPQPQLAPALSLGKAAAMKTATGKDSGKARRVGRRIKNYHKMQFALETGDTKRLKALLDAADTAKTADLIPGGKGDGKSKKLFDPKEFAMGLKVEREHTTDPAKMKEITSDHLVEDKKYYTKLDAAGLADELGKKGY